MVFETPGIHNTRDTLTIALDAARQLGISRLVVASKEGYTLQQLLELDRSGITVVGVTHSFGFRDPRADEFPPDVRARLEAQGVRLVTGTHVLSGAERGISSKFGGSYPVEIMAHTLRMLGQGMKVCVEIAVMALDAGQIPYMEPVIAVGGTRSGADTAVVIRPAHAADIFETKIDRVLCKPQL